MEKEDILLGEMGRLVIQPVKLNKTRREVNPFVCSTQRFHESNIIPNEIKCACAQRKFRYTGITKKKHERIIKEPVLNILKQCRNDNVIVKEECQEPSSKLKVNISKCDPLNLCTLVRNCNELKISTNISKQDCSAINKNNAYKWWKADNRCKQHTKDSREQSSRPGSCSQQVLHPPCDVTIDELASYFETLVHIPKKMSSMAEMMYI